MQNNINGKVIVITGASSGLGEAAARHLAAEGASVVLAARRTERIESLAEKIKRDGGDALAITTDVTVRDEVTNLVDKTVEKLGRIDVMVNNAGMMLLAPLEAFKVDEWDQMIDINIKGMLYGIAAALPQMQKQKSGHFVNVSSVAGHKVMQGGAVYCATKHAVRALSEGLRSEVKPYNIRTTIISPGAVDTELTDHITHDETSKMIDKMIGDIALPPDSFARCVAFAINQPAELDINEVLFRPTAQEL